MNFIQRTVQWLTIASFGFEALAFPMSTTGAPSVTDWKNWEASSMTTSPTPVSFTSLSVSRDSASTTNIPSFIAQATQIPDGCLSYVGNHNDIGNLVGIPQAGDVVILEKGVRPSEVKSKMLINHVKRVITNSSLNVTRSPLVASLAHAIDESNELRQDELVAVGQASELNALLEGCWEDEGCMFFNTTTYQVIDIFHYMAKNGLSSTQGSWTRLTQSIQQALGLGLLFAPTFTSGSPGISLDFLGDHVSVSQPGILRAYDVIRSQ